MGSFTLRDPNDIGVAVLGAGRMGQTHVRNMAAIPNAHVVVVADPVAEAAERAATWRGRSAPPTDTVEAILDPEVEAVVIVTPTDTHATLIETALRAGKAVWSEKPIAQEMAETARIVDLWRELDIPVQLGFMRRFDPGYERAKRLIDNGELGRIEQFRALSRDTFPPPLEYLLGCGGSFLDMSLPRPGPRAVPRGRGGGGPRLGVGPVRRAVREGGRLGHVPGHAQVPQRRPGRGGDVPALRVGL